jgi:hypothetical protein
LTTKPAGNPFEGRDSDEDFWRPICEISFEPSQLSQYIDFPKNRIVSQIRITVQDITYGTGVFGSGALYLPPIQIFGITAEIEN